MLAKSRQRLSLAHFCLIGAVLTCISILGYLQEIDLNVSHSTKRDDIAFKPPELVRNSHDKESLQAAESRALSDDVSSKIEEWSETKRLDISCCGIGHRFHTMAAAARDMSPSRVAIHWGPCQDVGNVFSKIFKSNNSTFVPYIPVDGDVPFPEMRNLTRAGVDLRQTAIPDEVQNSLVDLLLNSLSDQYMSIVNDFTETVGWDDAPVISLHIRTGNIANSTFDHEHESKQLFRRVGGRIQEEIGLKNALHFYMSHAAALAIKMGIFDNYQVLVVTDSNDVIELLKTIEGLPGWFHRPQTYHDVAHPLVYGNLLLNNAGDSCKLDWFSEPIIDMHLLASSAAMLTSMRSITLRRPKSSEYWIWQEVAEKAHLKNGRPVCHCSQNDEDPLTCQWVSDTDVIVPQLSNYLADVSMIHINVRYQLCSVRANFGIEQIIENIKIKVDLHHCTI